MNTETQQEILIRPSKLNEDSIEKSVEYQTRDVINNYVILHIFDMEMDGELAQIILNSLDDKYFKEGNENEILRIVIDNLLQQKANKMSYKLLRQSLNSEESQQIVQIYSSRISIHEEIKENLVDGIECPVCYQIYSKDNTEKIFTLNCCKQQVCLECLKMHLRNEILNFRVFQIHCINDICHEPMSESLIKNIIDEELYQKMIKFQKMKVLLEDNNIRWCTRPGCENYMRRQNDEKTLVCGVCKQEVCFKCGGTAHPNISCKKAQDCVYNEAKEKFSIQPCPKCQAPIQKNEGCNHMTCQKCHFQFCWLCRGKYTYNHYSAYNFLGCPKMQFSQRQPFKHPNCYRFFLVLGIILFGPLLAVLFGIGAFLVAVFGLPIFVFNNCVSTQRMEQCPCCCRHTTYYFLGMFSIIFSPISLAIIICVGLVVIILSIPYSIFAFFYWLCCSR